MGNCKDNCILRACSIDLKRGVYTITVSDGSLTGLLHCDDILIGLYSASIPTDSTCNLVEVTDGTTTLPVYLVERCCDGGCVANLWRTTLHCRTILCTKYSASGENLTLQTVKGRHKGAV